MSYHARRFLPPGGASRKRKERETASYSTWPSSPVTGVSSPSQKATTSSKQAEPPASGGSSNRLLAGYMAYEFLTSGTLFGQKFDPARAEAFPVNNNNNLSSELKRGSKPGQSPTSQEPEPSQAYIEVATLLKNEGAHIPGVVNPMQLARWIQM
nr:embryo sac development arrest protein [Ipomoea batatas]GMD81626.1 embryo sac development arrest protein [Ipomoea batatas]GMD95232.1 embryo sac development arrest protein [Ipomoea batatas]